MPYGAIMTQSVLSAAREDAHDNRLPRASRLPEGLPSGSRNNKNKQHQESSSHYHGEARSTSGGAGFAGVMRALLKPTPGAPASRTRSEGQGGFQPRTALDLSGHSFSKELKAEISRSKQNVALKSKSVHTDSHNHAEASTHWWEKNSRRWGGDLDDKGLSRVSSSSTIPPSPPSSFSSAAPPDMHAHGNVAAHGGGYHDMRPAGAYQQQHYQHQHYQHQHQHQQMGSVYRSRSFDDMSLAVGMQ